MQIKIKGKCYELLSNIGTVERMRGERRDVILLDLGIIYDEFCKIGVSDNMKWSIIDEVENEKGEKVKEEHDYSNHNLLGDIIIHSNNTVSFYMLKSTKAELLKTVIDDLLEV